MSSLFFDKIINHFIFHHEHLHTLLNKKANLKTSSQKMFLVFGKKSQFPKIFLTKEVAKKEMKIQFVSKLDLNRTNCKCVNAVESG